MGVKQKVLKTLTALFIIFLPVLGGSEMPVLPGRQSVADVILPQLVTPVIGYNTTAGAYIYPTGQSAGLFFPNDAQAGVRAIWRSPITGTVRVTVIAYPYSTGDVYGILGMQWGALGEALAQHSYNTGSITHTVSSGTQRVRLHDTGAQAVTAGDYVHMYFDRNAVNAADTLEDNVAIIGFLIEAE